MEGCDHGTEIRQVACKAGKSRIYAICWPCPLRVTQLLESDCIGIVKIGDKISFHECEESTPWEYALEPQGLGQCPDSAKAASDMYYSPLF